MIKELRPAIVLLALFTLLTGLGYPLAITGLAQLLAPGLANGSLVRRDGQVVGSALVGQIFSSPRYFHGRPSATGDKPYDAANSSGSNLGPTSAKLVARVKADIAKWRREDSAGVVPADAVTTSASGLDPDVSPATALAQVGRVAAARGLREADVHALAEGAIERPFLGIVGEPRVNVLRINLALDALQSPREPAGKGALEPK